MVLSSIYIYICIHMGVCVCVRVCEYIYIFMNTEEYTIPRSQIYWPLYVCFLCLKNNYLSIRICTHFEFKVTWLRLLLGEDEEQAWNSANKIIYSILKSAFNGFLYPKVLNFDVLTDPWKNYVEWKLGIWEELWCDFWLEY